MKKLKEYKQKLKKISNPDSIILNKIRMEYQDNMRDDLEDELFNEMAMEALMDLGLPEDEAERELEDYNN